MALAQDPSQDPHGEKGWDIPGIVADLKRARETWRLRSSRERDAGEREFPSPERIQEAAGLLRGALFPLRLGPPDLHREGEDHYVGHALGHALGRALHILAEEVRLELATRHADARERVTELRADAHRRVSAFGAAIPKLRSLLDTDVEAAFLGDPAARSVNEVLLCYPGVHALIHHRIAHELYQLDLPLIARIIAGAAHAETGIDIHPGARIGRYCFIDHGTGVVIGETVDIGNHVRIHQAVTIDTRRAGESGDIPARAQSRHPLIEDGVVINAGASILGRVTIGKGASIGGNVWVTQSVPAGRQITQAGNEQSAVNA